MSESSTKTPSDWLKVINQHHEDAADGLWLEHLVSDLGSQIPEWGLKDAILWEDWRDRETHFPDAKKTNYGIDCVGIRTDDALVAIQCKARKPDTELTHSEISTFIADTQNKLWRERWVVTNATFSLNLKKSLSTNDNPVRLVDFVDPVSRLCHQENEILDDAELTKMQNECVTSVVRGLQEFAVKGRSSWNEGEARGTIVLPCGTGKTRVAYRVMKEIANPKENDVVVVLVPSIALVSQIKGQFQTLAIRDKLDVRTLAVCSDKTAGQTRQYAKEDSANLHKDPTIDNGYVHDYEIVGDTALDEEQVVQWLEDPAKEGTLRILFSTYQSSHNTAAGLLKTRLKAKLTICDEAHRTAGVKKIPKNGERLRNFTLCHDKDRFPSTYRLYQTATPRVYSATKLRDQYFGEDDSDWDVRSMSDESTFGPELHRVSYVEAVNRNLLSDYRIVAWGISDEEAKEAEDIAAKLNKLQKQDDEDSIRWTPSLAMRALTLAAFLAGCLPDANIRSVIAFCNRVKISSELASAVKSKPIQTWLKKYFRRIGIEHKPLPFDVVHVDARHPTLKRNNALRELGQASENKSFCISNVGIFGEGTDSPKLSAVAFLNPRKSPVDVIQAVGRAMRKSPDKERGLVLVPVVIPSGYDPEHFLRNSSPEQGWQELGQILQALRAHDGRIEDHLVDLMDFYVPPPSREPAVHIVIVNEPGKSISTYEITTTSQTIEEIVAKSERSSNKTIEEVLKKQSTRITNITNNNDAANRLKPKSITGVQVNKENETYLGDYTIFDIGSATRDNNLWDPAKAIPDCIAKFKKDLQSAKPKLRKVIVRRKNKKSDKQKELGLRLVHLGGETLAQTGIHLNLLEKSGIQSGTKRDVNLLRGTVEAVARQLRHAEVEEILALRLGMGNTQNQRQGAADACTVTSVIWFNAAITQVRLENSSISQLRNVPSLASAINRPEPAQGVLEAWGQVLIRDYVPIFHIAQQLLQDVAFKDLELVSDSIRLLAKHACEIASNYADIGADHAGELFNKVMGNQRSDGAFFTRPVAATMLAELSLNALGNVDWLDRDNWTNLRTFDPACGSGTILVAMMTAIKRRILLAGGKADDVRAFHRKAVEDLMIGADINPVALQLAACQLTLGELSALYDKINLHRLEYGPTGINDVDTNVKVGTVELLTDDRIMFKPKGNLGLSALEGSKIIELKDHQENVTKNRETLDLSDDLISNPPKFILMNPPYTPWRDIGSKFTIEIQEEIRNRLKSIWQEASESSSLLVAKMSSLATMFESLALAISKLNSGIMGLVRAATLLTAEDSRSIRQVIAREAHVDYILTSHDPKSFNMSWYTNVNECLIVLSKDKGDDIPTQFINLHSFPKSSEEAIEILDRATSDRPFSGSSFFQSYSLMKNGDWSPSAFGDCEIVDIARNAISSSERLRNDLIKTTSGRGGGGGGEMARWTIRYLEVMLSSKLVYQEETGE